MTYASTTYIEETRISSRYFSTRTWRHHLLRVAISDSQRPVDAPLPQGGTGLDAGCGQNESSRLRREVFAPPRLIGPDADPHSFAPAHAEVAREGMAVDTIAGDRAAIELPTARVDIVSNRHTPREA